MKRRNHTIDGAFALALFAVFAVCAMLLVLLGARVYGKIASNVNEMDAPMVLSYVTEKLRSSDASAVLVGEGGELLLQKETASGSYVTWIYVEDGYLKETLMPEGKEPIPNAGTVVAPVQKISAEMTAEMLLEISVTDFNGDSLVRYFQFPMGKEETV